MSTPVHEVNHVCFLLFLDPSEREAKRKLNRPIVKATPHELGPALLVPNPENNDRKSDVNCNLPSTHDMF